MAVLGGFSTDGGKGKFPGLILAIFIVGMLRYGLGLIKGLPLPLPEPLLLQRVHLSVPVWNHILQAMR